MHPTNIVSKQLILFLKVLESDFLILAISKEWMESLAKEILRLSGGSTVLGNTYRPAVRSSRRASDQSDPPKTAVVVFGDVLLSSSSMKAGTSNCVLTDGKTFKMQSLQLKVSADNISRSIDLHPLIELLKKASKSMIEHYVKSILSKSAFEFEFHDGDDVEVLDEACDLADILTRNSAMRADLFVGSAEVTIPNINEDDAPACEKSLSHPLVGQLFEAYVSAIIFMTTNVLIATHVLAVGTSKKDKLVVKPAVLSRNYFLSIYKCNQWTPHIGIDFAKKVQKCIDTLRKKCWKIDHRFMLLFASNRCEISLEKLFDRSVSEEGAFYYAQHARNSLHSNLPDVAALIDLQNRYRARNGEYYFFLASFDTQLHEYASKILERNLRICGQPVKLMFVEEVDSTCPIRQALLNCFTPTFGGGVECPGVSLFQDLIARVESAFRGLSPSDYRADHCNLLQRVGVAETGSMALFAAKFHEIHRKNGWVGKSPASFVCLGCMAIIFILFEPMQRQEPSATRTNDKKITMVLRQLAADKSEFQSKRQLTYLIRHGSLPLESLRLTL